MDRQRLGGQRRPGVVSMIHAHERRDVKRLVELTSEHRRVALLALDDVGVPLAPGRVRHLRDQRLHPLAARLEAVVEADGVEAVPERAQLRQQTDRALGPRAGLVLHHVTHGAVQRHRGIAQVIAAAKADQPWTPGDQSAVKQPRELVEIEVGQRQPMAELAPGVEAPVANRALVDTARAHSRAPKRSAHPQRADNPVLMEPPPPVGAAEVRPVAPVDLTHARLRLDPSLPCTPGARRGSCGSRGPGRSPRCG